MLLQHQIDSHPVLEQLSSRSIDEHGWEDVLVWFTVLEEREGEGGRSYEEEGVEGWWVVGREGLELGDEGGKGGE